MGEQTEDINETYRDYSMESHNVGLNILKAVFMNPLETSKNKQYMLGFVCLFVTFLTYYMIYLELLTSEGAILDDITKLTQLFTTFSSYSQIITKMIPLIVYREHITNIFQKRKYYWKPHPKNQPDLFKYVQHVQKMCYLVVRLFSFMVLCLAMVNIIKPFFTKELPTVVYVPQVKYGFEAVFIFQISYCVILCPVINANVILFLCLMVDIIMQFHILNYNIVNIQGTDTERMRRLKECFKHHNFLFQCIADFQKLFSYQLLGEYIITVLSACSEGYNLTESSTTFNNKASSFVYVYTLLTEYAVFCFPAGYLTDIAVETADAFYESNWEERDRDYKTCVTFGIMRAQKEVTLKAGGMIYINRGTYIKVFKTAFSVLTLFRGLNERS